MLMCFQESATESLVELVSYILGDWLVVSVNSSDSGTLSERVTRIFHLQFKQLVARLRMLDVINLKQKMVENRSKNFTVAV